MTIGGVSCGARQTPAVDRPNRITTIGKSTAGVVTAFDMGYSDIDVIVVFHRMVTATKDSLKTALETTAKPGGVVSVVPDSGDDLGVGAAGATNFYYMGGFTAEYNEGTPGTWRVTVPLRYVA